MLDNLRSSSLSLWFSLFRKLILLIFCMRIQFLYSLNHNLVRQKKDYIILTTLMSRKDFNKKINFEKTQLRSILSDFRKAKFKCIALADDLKEEIPNKVHFDSVERETVLKMELLDYPGLVALKNTLAKTLTELLDLQSELMMKKERKVLHLEIHNNNKASHNLVQTVTPKGNRNISMQEFDRKNNKVGQSSKPIDNDILDAKMKNRGHQMYIINEHESENVEKNVQKSTAKKKGKAEGESLSGKKGLYEDPVFLKMKEELQRFKMREQEIESLIEKKIKEALDDFLMEGEVIEETANYKVVKFMKGSYISDEESSYLRSDFNKKSPTQINVAVGPVSQFRRMVSMEAKSCVVKGKDKDIIEIESELQKQSYNMDEVVSRISSTMEASEFKLREIRQQRRRIVMEDDVWAEFEQM